MALKTKTGLSAIALTVIAFLFVLIAFCTPCWLVADGTLPSPNFERIVFFEPTDIPICSKPFKTKYWKTIKYITPNLGELKHIAATLEIPFSESSANPVEEAARTGKIIAEHIPNIVITLGEHGVVVVRRAPASSPLYNYKTSAEDFVQARHYVIEKIEKFTNVSGAGDCLASGVVAGMLMGLNEEKCVQVGFAAATLAMHSDSAVPKLLFNKNHPAWNSSAKYQQL